LVVATEGAPPDRGDAVALIFEHLYWISRSRIGRCSRDEAIKYHNELKAMEPHRHTVAEARTMRASSGSSAVCERPGEQE
jgi:hypothetical protein